MQYHLTNCRVATMRRGNPYGLIDDAVVTIRDGHIAQVGAVADREIEPGEERVDLGGRLVTPGLIDCHTHLVYAGNRAEEWALRLEGASYEEIARRGGGIVSTVAANTRRRPFAIAGRDPGEGSAHCWPRASPRSR